MNSKNEQRWLQFWRRVGGQGEAKMAYDDLVARYFEPHRAYHTLEHIEQCLSELDQVRHLAVNTDVVEMALWYHDAVYDTRAKNNEEKSAELLLLVSKNVSLPNSFGQQAANLILATKHTGNPTDPDAQLLVDIDLSILGQSWARFDEYEHQIREEYRWVSEEMFAAGRSTILESFMERPMIYSTQFFRDKYEAQARQNISRSLARLQKHP